MAEKHCPVIILLDDSTCKINLFIKWPLWLPKGQYPYHNKQPLTYLLIGA